MYCFVKQINNKILIAILIFTFVNIAVTDVFLQYNIKIALNNNIYIIISFFLWLVNLKKKTDIQEANYLIILFVIFSVCNLLFFEYYNKLNTKTFVFGTLVYLFLFVYICVSKLKQEKLDFFINNNFILISSPILFFVGYSLMFGFKNKIINDIILFNEIKLFDIISNFVNFTFYTLINIYVFKENKIKNV